MNIKLTCTSKIIEYNNVTATELSVLGWCATKAAPTAYAKLNRICDAQHIMDGSIVLPCTSDLLESCNSVDNNIIIILQSTKIDKAGHTINHKQFIHSMDGSVEDANV